MKIVAIKTITPPKLESTSLNPRFQVQCREKVYLVVGNPRTSIVPSTKGK